MNNYKYVIYSIFLILELSELEVQQTNNKQAVA